MPVNHDATSLKVVLLTTFIEEPSNKMRQNPQLFEKKLRKNININQLKEILVLSKCRNPSEESLPIWKLNEKEVIHIIVIRRKIWTLNQRSENNYWKEPTLEVGDHASKINSDMKDKILQPREERKVALSAKINFKN